MDEEEDVMLSDPEDEDLLDPDDAPDVPLPSAAVAASALNASTGGRGQAKALGAAVEGIGGVGGGEKGAEGVAGERGGAAAQGGDALRAPTTVASAEAGIDDSSGEAAGTKEARLLWQLREAVSKLALEKGLRRKAEERAGQLEKEREEGERERRKAEDGWRRKVESLETHRRQLERSLRDAEAAVKSEQELLNSTRKELNSERDRMNSARAELNSERERLKIARERLKAKEEERQELVGALATEQSARAAAEKAREAAEERAGVADSSRVRAEQLRQAAEEAKSALVSKLKVLVEEAVRRRDEALRGKVEAEAECEMALKEVQELKREVAAASIRRGRAEEEREEALVAAEEAGRGRQAAQGEAEMWKGVLGEWLRVQVQQEQDVLEQLGSMWALLVELEPATLAMASRFCSAAEEAQGGPQGSSQRDTSEDCKIQGTLAQQEDSTLQGISEGKVHLAESNGHDAADEIQRKSRFLRSTNSGASGSLGGLRDPPPLLPLPNPEKRREELLSLFMDGTKDWQQLKGWYQDEVGKVKKQASRQGQGLEKGWTLAVASMYERIRWHGYVMEAAASSPAMSAALATPSPEPSGETEVASSSPCPWCSLNGTRDRESAEEQLSGSSDQAQGKPNGAKALCSQENGAQKLDGSNSGNSSSSGSNSNSSNVAGRSGPVSDFLQLAEDLGAALEHLQGLNMTLQDKGGAGMVAGIGPREEVLWKVRALRSLCRGMKEKVLEQKREQEEQEEELRRGARAKEATLGEALAALEKDLAASQDEAGRQRKDLFSLRQEVEELSSALSDAKKESQKRKDAAEREAEARVALSEEAETLREKLEMTTSEAQRWIASAEELSAKVKAKEALAEAAVQARLAAERGLRVAERRAAELAERLEECQQQREEEQKELLSQRQRGRGLLSSWSSLTSAAGSQQRGCSDCARQVLRWAFARERGRGTAPGREGGQELLVPLV